ncbi:MAG: nucleotidyltransferase domain-containing protein [Candidatus Cloacimonadota bacterium]|nr:nucleotidyltransferase domain-containing protein [Candidatus Cloacimonadota bacterium]
MYNKKAMIELKKLLIKKYPEIIDKLILFGSRAENRENEFSDYDILLILKEQYNREFEENVLDIAYDIILKYDILTDLKFITNDELKTIKGALPFVQSAMNNGVVI